MDWLIGVDWTQVFGPDTPLLEIFVRGSFMYLGIFVLLRAMLGREAGMVALPDILMIVLLADAAQNGMTDDYHSMPDGILLVGVIIFWNLALDRLAFRFPFMARLIHPPPLPDTERPSLAGQPAAGINFERRAMESSAHVRHRALTQARRIGGRFERVLRTQDKEVAICSHRRRSRHKIAP